MSQLAQKLAATEPTTEYPRRGPTNSCGRLYQADIEDWAAIDEFRRRPGESWRSAQRRWDELTGVTHPIHTDKFRYHWRRRCGCWPDDLRLS